MTGFPRRSVDAVKLAINTCTEGEREREMGAEDFQRGPPRDAPTTSHKGGKIAVDGQLIIFRWDPT